MMAACLLGLLGQLVVASLDDDFPKASRYDGAQMPLVGLGVGNLPADRMNQVVNHALAGDSPMGYRLIDTGARNECRAGVTERIAAKSKNNECELFEPKIVQEFDSDSGAEGDAKSAFDALFDF